MKKILIAIPTARYIEPETFRSIYNQKIPSGYTVEFQYFYGYRVDQVRNLIADWVVRGYDYLFAVDHDMTFPADTLAKMLKHDKDLVTGIYRQRVEPQSIEIYDLNQQRMTIEQLHGQGLTQIGGCGFGCVLIKKNVFEKIGYPQFEYHVALNHSNTVSEDTDFCIKAMKQGFTLWCDPTILCGHIGATTMYVDLPIVTSYTEKYKKLRTQKMLPQAHIDYLFNLKWQRNINCIYDVGSNMLHWYDAAQEVWPDAHIVAFEAMNAVTDFYIDAGIDYLCGAVLSSTDGVKVAFYENLDYPAGNSMYKENVKYNPVADEIFSEGHKVERCTMTLDTAAKHKRNPDLIKIDVQGAELDVLKGATETLKHCNDLIVELQHKEYNIGGAQSHEVIEFLESIGFEMVGSGPFCSTDVDGDYHFTRIHHRLD